MARPQHGLWRSFDLDEEYATHAHWNVGDILEIECIDLGSDPQGRGILVVTGVGERTRLYTGHSVAVSDDDYRQSLGYIVELWAEPMTKRKNSRVSRSYQYIIGVFSIMAPALWILSQHRGLNAKH